MKSLFLLAIIALASNVYGIDYPQGPDRRITPGSLCDRPTQYRYPEHIAYCERDVTTQTKNDVFATYRNELGFKLDLRNRSNYKIDHFIPLCAGGSNHEDNLWPQHITVFTITDPLEPLACAKLSEGRITQKAVIELIKRAKYDLKQVPAVIKYLNSL